MLCQSDYNIKTKVDNNMNHMLTRNKEKKFKFTILILFSVNCTLQYYKTEEIIGKMFLTCSISSYPFVMTYVLKGITNLCTNFMSKNNCLFHAMCLLFQCPVTPIRNFIPKTPNAPQTTNVANKILIILNNKILFYSLADDTTSVNF